MTQTSDVKSLFAAPSPVTSSRSKATERFLTLPLHLKFEHIIKLINDIINPTSSLLKEGNIHSLKDGIQIAISRKTYDKRGSSIVENIINVSNEYCAAMGHGAGAGAGAASLVNGSYHICKNIKAGKGLRGPIYMYKITDGEQIDLITEKEDKTLFFPSDPEFIFHNGMDIEILQKLEGFLREVINMKKITPERPSDIGFFAGLKSLIPARAGAGVSGEPRMEREADEVSADMGSDTSVLVKRGIEITPLDPSQVALPAFRGK